jgi:hypothetical protein
MRRTLLVAFLLVVGTGCTGTGDPPAGAPEPPAAVVGHMTMARAAHTATALADGRVLIAGGCTTDGCGGTPEGGRTEFYDQGRFVPGPPMVHARASHTATRLEDGRVLFVGGWPDEGRPPLSSAEVFDPATGGFAELAPAGISRGGHTATLLRDGRVLIVGGVDGRRALSSVEIFDPASGRFSPAAPLPGPRATHAATRLTDGRVLVAGGQTEPGHGRGIVGSAVVYDPDRDAWSPVGPLSEARYKTVMVALPDGGALVLGGQTADEAQARLATTERYDPLTATFKAGPVMTEPRYKISDAAAVLRDGRVAVAGGYGVDVIADSVTRAGESTVERQSPTLTELADGSVLVAGGYNDHTQPTNTVLLVRP